MSYELQELNAGGTMCHIKNAVVDPDEIAHEINLTLDSGDKEYADTDLQITLVCYELWGDKDRLTITPEYQRIQEQLSKVEQLEKEHEWMKTFLVEMGIIKEVDGELGTKYRFVDEENDVDEERYRKFVDTFEAKLLGSWHEGLKKRHESLLSRLQKTKDGVIPEDGQLLYRVEPKHGRSNIVCTSYTQVNSPCLEDWYSSEEALEAAMSCQSAQTEGEGA